MRVNNINCPLSFKRVIPINYTRLENAKYLRGVDEDLLEIEDILNSYEPYFYSKEESDRIREFFRQKIEDYNGRSGALIVQTGKKAVLLTGSDASHIKNLRASGKSEEQVAGVISNRLENGRSGRAKSSITFLSGARDGVFKAGKPLSQKELSRFDEIKYTYEYSSTRTEKFKMPNTKKFLSAFATEIYDNTGMKI